MEKITNPRQLAIMTLNQFQDKEDFLREVLDFHLRQNPLKSVDQALYTELVYGTVRMQYNLDYVLSLFSSRPLGKIKPAILNVLRQGVYQLLYLDRIPDSAAVNEAVKLARLFGHEGVAKFTNGLLRQIARKRADIHYPFLETDPIGHLSAKYSYPPWIIELWLKWWGVEETRGLCQAMNEAPTMHIRINTLKKTPNEVKLHLEAQGVTVNPGKIVPEIFEVSPAHLVVRDSWLGEGHYYIQDESSSLVAHALRPLPGQLVYDLCSAPGGKTTHIAQLMENQGSILAYDVNPARLKLVEENAKRQGISIIKTRQGDATQDLALAPAPRVLVDAPCSGLGTMGHRPDIRWRKNLSEIIELSLIQKNILAQAAKYVAPGGLLLYSTCTLTKFENQDVAQWFLDQHPNFQGDAFPDWFPKTQNEANWMKTLFPHRDGVDGFFLAVFRRGRI